MFMRFNLAVLRDTIVMMLLWLSGPALAQTDLTAPEPGIHVIAAAKAGSSMQPVSRIWPGRDLIEPAVSKLSGVPGEALFVRVSESARDHAEFVTKLKQRRIKVRVVTGHKTHIRDAVQSAPQDFVVDDCVLFESWLLPAQQAGSVVRLVNPDVSWLQVTDTGQIVNNARYTVWLEEIDTTATDEVLRIPRNPKYLAAFLDAGIEVIVQRPGSYPGVIKLIQTEQEQRARNWQKRVIDARKLKSLCPHWHVEHGSMALASQYQECTGVVSDS